MDEDVKDEQEEEAVSSPAPAKKRKLTKAQEKKKVKGKDDDEEDDPYTSLSKSMWANSNPRPPAGSFENCARCGKQFTVVCGHSTG